MVCLRLKGNLDVIILIFIILAYPSNIKAGGQTLSIKLKRKQLIAMDRAGSKSTMKRNCVSPFKCHGQLLKQIRRLFWITSDIGGAFFNLFNQFDRLVVRRRFSGIENMVPG